MTKVFANVLLFSCFGFSFSITFFKLLKAMYGSFHINCAEPLSNIRLFRMLFIGYFFVDSADMFVSLFWLFQPPTKCLTKSMVKYLKRFLESRTQILCTLMPVNRNWGSTCQCVSTSPQEVCGDVLTHFHSCYFKTLLNLEHCNHCNKNWYSHQKIQFEIRDFFPQE